MAHIRVARKRPANNNRGMVFSALSAKQQLNNNREAVFSVWSVPRCYKRKITDSEVAVHTRVEAGSNTSTVTLRVVGGDGKGSLKSEAVKYGREYQGTRTRERLR
jgi:hypothetical protein